MCFSAKLYKWDRHFHHWHVPAIESQTDEVTGNVKIELQGTRVDFIGERMVLSTTVGTQTILTYKQSNLTAPSPTAFFPIKELVRQSETR
eukprot:gene3542-2192_t